MACKVLVKVLQLIYESLGSPFGFGGAGVRAYEIYKRLGGRHDITLLCMKYPGSRDGEIEGLRHLFVGTESRSLTMSVLAYTVRAAHFVYKHGNEFDVIVENFLPSTPFLAGLLTRKPVVLQVQGIMERHAMRKFSPLYAFPMYLVEMSYPRLYNRFIFVSPVTREKVMRGMDERKRTSTVIPNGVGREYFDGMPAEGNYILFFSRIDIYTKGLDILMKAFQQIAGEFPDLRLVLAGYEFDDFEGLVSGMDGALRERVEYAGFLAGREKLKLLAGARLFVLPSRHESAPISVLEAAACGKPAVVSDIPELAFVKEEGFGLIFPAGSEEALADSLRSLLKDEALRRMMGGRARDFAKRFLWDEIAESFERTLQDVVR